MSVLTAKMCLGTKNKSERTTVTFVLLNSVQNIHHKHCFIHWTIPHFWQVCCFVLVHATDNNQMLHSRLVQSENWLGTECIVNGLAVIKTMMASPQRLPRWHSQSKEGNQSLRVRVQQGATPKTCHWQLSFLLLILGKHDFVILISDSQQRDKAISPGMQVPYVCINPSLQLGSHISLTHNHINSSQARTSQWTPNDLSPQTTNFIDSSHTDPSQSRTPQWTLKSLSPKPQTSLTHTNPSNPLVTHLASFTGQNTIVNTRGLVTAHQTLQGRL